jgi:Nucleotidyl transferase AbiEii toxin, Type IV TA system
MPPRKTRIKLKATIELPTTMKAEINTREINAFDPPPQTIRYVIENPWYGAGVDIATFSREELLATKLRALLQPDKARDLLDLYLDLFHALQAFQDLNSITTLILRPACGPKVPRIGDARHLMILGSRRMPTPTHFLSGFS